MDKHTFKISISGNASEAKQKASAVAILASYLDAKTLKALARVVKTDPDKVRMAKQFLGV
jgi:predicted transcriptional regulator with HTH domain